MRANKEVDGNVEPFRVAIEMLNRIPGVSSLSAEVIVAEIGIDMSRFETAGHLVSWAGLCPSNDESAGKRRSNRRKKGAPWLKPTLVQCAWAARAPRAATSKPNTTAYAAAAAPKRRSEP
jgi:transposase